MRFCNVASFGQGSCPGRVQRGEAERNESRDPAQYGCRLRSVLSPLGPGSSLADARSAGTREQCPPHAPFVTQQCQTAQCSSFPRRVSAPGFVFIPSHPSLRGAGGAPTGALILLSRVRGATDPRSVRRGASHDAGRSPLGAPPWRFSAGGRASISGIASGSVQRAPRSQVVMPGGRCPGPPDHRSVRPGDNR